MLFGMLGWAMKYDNQAIVDTAMQIISDEHHLFFVKRGDNCEHIHRIVRIAKSVGTLLANNGMSQQDVTLQTDKLID